jgi:hypothetical protein
VSISGIPPSVNRRVLEAVIAQLQGYPALANRRVVKTWLLWDGKADIAPPSEAALPASMIRLISGPTRRIAGARAPGQPMQNINESRPQIMVDLWTAGTDQGDLADVAGVIMTALAPQDAGERTSMNERFRRAGIKDIQLVREILPLSAESFDSAGIWGSGTYELTVHSFA